MRVSPLFTILLSAFLLQGCVAAAVVGVAGMTAKTITDPRTVGSQIDDSTLKARVCNAISKEKKLKGEFHIVVTVYQGKVLLTGQVPTPDVADYAKQIAMNVDGTTEVHNEIRTSKPIGMSTASTDMWITIKVRSRLLSGDSVKSSNVKVITENGEVFLLGLVTQEEGKSVAGIAARVSGVKKVLSAFTYVK